LVEINILKAKQHWFMHEEIIDTVVLGIDLLDYS
jgi:hypothetical protein